MHLAKYTTYGPWGDSEAQGREIEEAGRWDTGAEVKNHGEDAVEERCEENIWAKGVENGCSERDQRFL